MQAKIIRNVVIVVILVFIGGVVVYCTNKTDIQNENIKQTQTIDDNIIDKNTLPNNPQLDDNDTDKIQQDSQHTQDTITTQSIQKTYDEENQQNNNKTTPQTQQDSKQTQKHMQESNNKTTQASNNKNNQEVTQQTIKQNTQQDSRQMQKYTQQNENKSGVCIVAPNCNNPSISKQLAITSLDLHANMRAKEEERIKGQVAGEEFMRLWRQTRKTILPKLTSHVSNIYDQGMQANGQTRTCVANYYTEVLEDFGHGWKDKKGDKSPVYKVIYRVACKDLNTAKLTILEESQSHKDRHNTNQMLMRQDNKIAQHDIGRIPPACNAPAVYRQLAQTGFYTHAMARAQEEGRIQGYAAQQKFMQLWEKTQAKVTTRLAARVSNVRDQGIQASKQIRTCMANYYTEVLEDFGHGWKDKKGDKSPYYLVYYTVAYANNEDESIVIKITAQNRVRTH